MSEPCYSTPATLGPHWNILVSDLTPCLHPRASKVALESEVVGDRLITHFSGSIVRRAARHRGGSVPVVPLRDLAHNWEVWLGYREVWMMLGGRNRFIFSSSDITVFFVVANSEAFQQILRAEWMGPAKDSEGWYFRPSDAGHPHWQVDVIDVLRADANLEAAHQLLMDAEPREFGNPDLARLADPPWYEIGRMHFASAMRPWVDSLIAHGPSNLAAVRAWVVNTIGTLNIELARL
jgi:hypothetical protein